MLTHLLEDVVQVCVRLKRVVMMEERKDGWGGYGGWPYHVGPLVLSLERVDALDSVRGGAYPGFPV